MSHTTSTSWPASTGAGSKRSVDCSLASVRDRAEDGCVSNSGLVDFHCHLDLYPDHAAAVAECERAGVFTLTVTTTPKAWPRNHQLATATRHVRAALGLHPQLAA